MMTDPACSLVAAALGIQGEVSLDDTMHTLPAWDSMTQVALMLELEARLGRPLTGDELGSLDSVRAVAALLETASPPAPDD